MIVLELESYYSLSFDIHFMDLDPDLELETWEPESLADVYQDIELDIEGWVQGGERPVFAGASTFHVTVATPEALRAREAKPTKYSPYFTGRHHIIVLQWNWPEVLAYLQALIADCAGETWEEVGVKLSRYFEWEYGYWYPASFPFTKPSNSLLSGYLHPDFEYAEYKYRTVW